MKINKNLKIQEIMKINKNLKIQEISYPYKIWIIDDFFENEIIEKIKESWREIEEKNWHRGYDKINGKINTLEKGMKAISRIDLMPPFLSQVMQYFHSLEFTEFISQVVNEDLIPDDSMRWSGLRVMEANSYQLIHSDARAHPDNLLTKELTCLFYLNENYEKNTHEGCLEIWDDSMQNRTHEIEPFNNRMVMFLNSETSFHGVPNVKVERKAITFSVMSKKIASLRSKALFVSRPNDSPEIGEIGKERSEIKDKRK